MSATTQRGVGGCLILFALPFAAVGVFAGFVLIRHLAAWTESRDWVETPAIIESVTLDPEYEAGSGGASMSTDGFPVRARYTYEYEGQRHKGDRVWLGGFSDDLGTFHSEIHRELSGHQRSGVAAVCFVNPDAPEEAVLYRDLRWRVVFFLSVFALMFGGVGFGLLAVIPLGRRKLAADRRFEKLYPEEPWQWKEHWRGGRIRAVSKQAALSPVIFALLWNLLAWPLAILTADEIFDPANRSALIVLLFPLVGIGLAVWAVRALVRWRKFGDSELELETFPVPAGGRLAGRVLTGWIFAPGVSPTIRLTCSRRSSGSKDSTRNVLWQREVLVPPDRVIHDGFRTAIPVEIVLPAEARESEDSAITWLLEVDAAVRGVDFQASFEVPVFGRLPSTPPEEVSAAHGPESDADPLLSSALAASGITMTPRASGGHRYEFARARQKGAAALLTVFALVWCGVVYLLWTQEAPVFFTVAFALAALLLLLGALDLWLTRREIEADSRGLTYRARFLGFGSSRHVPVDRIEGLEIDRGMQMGDKLYHRILLETSIGRGRPTLADKIGSLTLAERVVRAIRRDLDG